MKTQVISAEITICSFDELDDSQKILVLTAREATKGSYSPYSKFQVGAAVMLKDGTILKGANQENAAFGVTLCAERTALFHASACYPDQPVMKLAIAAQTNGTFIDNPSPCGSCRQVINEFEERYHQPVEIILAGCEHISIIKSVKDILPLTFNEF